MLNKKITAFITSALMVMSTSTAAMTSFTVVAADTPTAASAEAEHKYCEFCGKELPEGTLSTPLGIFLCSDCRGQGMGGTTTAPTTTVVTTSGPGGTNVEPPKQHMFHVEVMNKDSNDPIRDIDGIEILVEYEDGSTMETNYDIGLPFWIDKKGMDGTIKITSVPDGLLIDEDSAKGFAFPEDNEGVVLYVKSDPDYKPAVTTYTGGPAHTGTIVTTTQVTTTPPVTTTYPIKGEEMGIFVRGENYNFIGGVKVRVTYDDGTKKEFTTDRTKPVMVKHNGKGGTVELLTVPKGYELKQNSPKSVNFDTDTQFVNFEFKDVSASANFIDVKYEGNRTNYYAKPGQEINVNFMANGVEILSIESEYEFIDVTQWFTAETYPNHDTYAIVKISDDAPRSDPYFGNGYPIVVTYRPYNSESEFTQNIYFYISDGLSGTTTSAYTTTTTTTTTTVVWSEATSTTTTAMMDYATKAEYDDSPMKIGEIRAVRFYHPVTGTSTGTPVVECTSPNATITWDGADLIYVYATAAGDVKMYIRDSSCAFGTYVNLKVLDEKFEGTNTTTATTTTTETTTFDTVTTTTTTSRVPGQGIELTEVDDVVIAIDETAVQFENSGSFPFTEYSAEQFGNVKAGNKVKARFLYDTYSKNQITNAFTVEVTEESCEVKPSKAGDANCDGELNMADAVLIMQAIANPDKYGLGLTNGINLIGAANADIDGSGDISNMDALKIQQFKLGIIKKL